MNTRTRVTAIPTLLAAGAFAALPSMLRGAAAHGQATPEAASVAAWADLGLPELELHFTTEAVEGMPESIEAGRYLVTIHGEPTDEDYAFGPMFLQIPEGMTFDDLMAQASEDSDGPPAFYYESLVAGGPSILASTGETSAVGIVDLPSGEWIVAGSSLSHPPIPFTVTGELPDDLPVPESNATFTLGEMVIALTEGELVAGENLVKVENAGVQPHFVEVSKVPDGTTLENIEATIAGFMGGTPEAEPIAETDFAGFATTVDQAGGTTIWVTMDLEAGTYAALCFFPDRETGMPHAAMGMYTVFTVEAAG